MLLIKGKSYYEILGVARDASTEQIRDSYKSIARAYHPDSHFYEEIVDAPLSPEQEAFFKILTAAYSTLTDLNQRAEYDQALGKIDLKNIEDWDGNELSAFSTPQIKKRDDSRLTQSYSIKGRFGTSPNVKQDLEALRIEEESQNEMADNLAPLSSVINIKRRRWHNLPLIAGLLIGIGIGTVLMLILKN